MHLVWTACFALLIWYTCSRLYRAGWRKVGTTLAVCFCIMGVGFVLINFPRMVGAFY